MNKLPEFYIIKLIINFMLLDKDLYIQFAGLVMASKHFLSPSVFDNFSDVSDLFFAIWGSSTSSTGK